MSNAPWQKIEKLIQTFLMVVMEVWPNNNKGKSKKDKKKEKSKKRLDEIEGEKTN